MPPLMHLSIKEMGDDLTHVLINNKKLYEFKSFLLVKSLYSLDNILYIDMLIPRGMLSESWW